MVQRSVNNTRRCTSCLLNVYHWQYWCFLPRRLQHSNIDGWRLKGRGQDMRQKEERKKVSMHDDMMEEEASTKPSTGAAFVAWLFFSFPNNIKFTHIISRLPVMGSVMFGKSCVFADKHVLIVFVLYASLQLSWMESLFISLFTTGNCCLFGDLKDETVDKHSLSYLLLLERYYSCSRWKTIPGQGG